jgi:hypothetical protein
VWSWWEDFDAEKGSNRDYRVSTSNDFYNVTLASGVGKRKNKIRHLEYYS